MRRKNIIKCIVKMNKVKAKVWRKADNTIENTEFELPAIVEIEKYEVDNNIKVLEVISVVTEKAKFEMAAEEFIKIADRVSESKDDSASESKDDSASENKRKRVTTNG